MKALMMAALLSFHWTDPSTPAVLSVEKYQLDKGPKDELRVHLEPKDAAVLRELTAKNIGRTLILKEGDKVLATPKIKAAIEGQDFVVTMK